MSNLPPGARPVQINFGPGVALFQVWRMPSIIGGNAEILGPYPDAGTASVIAAKYPNALLVCCTCIHATPPAPPIANSLNRTGPTLTPVPK